MRAIVLSALFYCSKLALAGVDRPPTEEEETPSTTTTTTTLTVTRSSTVTITVTITITIITQVPSFTEWIPVQIAETTITVTATETILPTPYSGVPWHWIHKGDELPSDNTERNATTSMQRHKPFLHGAPTPYPARPIHLYAENPDSASFNGTKRPKKSEIDEENVKSANLTKAYEYFNSTASRVLKRSPEELSTSKRCETHQPEEALSGSNNTSSLVENDSLPDGKREVIESDKVPKLASRSSSKFRGGALSQPLITPARLQLRRLNSHHSKTARLKDSLGRPLKLSTPNNSARPGSGKVNDDSNQGKVVLKRQETDSIIERLPPQVGSKKPSLNHPNKPVTTGADSKSSGKHGSVHISGEGKPKGLNKAPQANSKTNALSQPGGKGAWPANPIQRPGQFNPHAAIPMPGNNDPLVVIPIDSADSPPVVLQPYPDTAVVVQDVGSVNSVASEGGLDSTSSNKA